MKRILICCLFGLFISCEKIDVVEPTPIDIFKVEQYTLEDKSIITFNVEKEGDYIVTMIDKDNDEVISREKIKCIPGKNLIKVYTKSIPSRYLYLTLDDSFNNRLGKTIITIK